MQKSVYVESIGQSVIIARRKGTRSLRIALRSDGVIRLSVPFLVSEKQAIAFLNQKADWVKKHHKVPTVIEPNAHIGKSHRLVFEFDSETLKTRISSNQITIKVPSTMDWSAPEVQKIAKKAAEKALKKEAEILLPQRLEALSVQHNIAYASIAIKKLKSRWGSCDSNKNITLNFYLIQLDWRLIDYVILHELAHTRYQHHQTDFWHYLTTILPDCKIRRKELKTKSTDIMPTSF